MEDRMLNDEILLGLIKANSGGGGGGTDDYEDLNNLPKINSVELKGNKSLSDLGIASATALADKVDKVEGKGLSTNDYTDADKAIVGGVTAALAGKQDALTAGSHIEIDDDEISVQRWAVPAGDVLYTVITGSGDYGREIHVQRHTVGGTLIDDREYHIDTWSSQDVDDRIRLAQGYGQWNISLLANSKEHNAGYSYSVNPNTTETSNSFTFTMEQEENANDLIIRSELDAKQDKLTFDDTPTDNSNNPVKSNGIYDALALKQPVTDNNLTTTDKTTTGAINELKSGLTNVADDVQLNTNDLTTPSRSINLMTLPITITKKLGSTGTVTNNNGVITLNGEFLQGEAISITCADCVVPNDAIIAYMNNVALPEANVAFYNGATKHDYYSFSIANRIIGNTALSTMVGKTINMYEVNFATAVTLDNFTFSLMMVHDGQNVSTYVPNIPSVNARIDNLVKTKEFTIATGTTQYDGFYYGTETHGISGKIISAYIRGTGSNHAAFLNYCNDTTIRVCSPVSETNVTVKVAYI